MIRAIVRCEERFRLLLLYALAVRDYARANELVLGAVGQSDQFEDANRRAAEAKAKCKAAREALSQHRNKHGC